MLVKLQCAILVSKDSGTASAIKASRGNSDLSPTPCYERLHRERATATATGVIFIHRLHLNKSIELDALVGVDMSQTNTHTESLDERDPDHKSPKTKSRRPASKHCPLHPCNSLKDTLETWLTIIVPIRHRVSSTALESMAVGVPKSLWRFKIAGDADIYKLNSDAQTNSYSQDRPTTLFHCRHYICSYRWPLTVREFAGQSTVEKTPTLVTIAKKRFCRWKKYLWTTLIA